MEYEVIRSSRKTVSLEITPRGTLLVRCPMRMSAEQIRSFVESKTQWIETHMAKRTANLQLSRFTEAQLRELADRALEIVPQRAAYFAPRIGVRYGRITIRNQRTRWGSCSSLGNLNFNCLLALVPPAVLDYVVVHELCHLKEMNHSDRFWAEVARVMPDYKVHKKWLDENGEKLIARL